MQSCSIKCMHTTSVRIGSATHAELKRLSVELGTSVGETVAIAVRRLRQEQIGKQLAAPLSSAEVSWLDAELG
jgi:thiazole synthase ThiGH ThiG subunit